MIRTVFLGAVAWLSVGLAAAGPLKIDRAIRKEPVYQTKAPKYGLLVFGPRGEDRVWVVLDGDTLYVDRNGTGDLTDPRDKVVAEKKPHRDPKEDGYAFDAGDLTVGGRKHKGLYVSLIPLKLYTDSSLGKRPEVKAALAKDPKALAVSLWLDVQVPGMKGGAVGGRVGF